MNHMNQIILEGICTEDAITKETLHGRTLTKFSIETSNYYKDFNGDTKLHTSFFEVEVWGRVLLYKKGQSVRVVGRLNQNRWKDINGEQRSKIIIVAEYIEAKKQEEK